MTLLLTSDEGHHNYIWCPSSDVSRGAILVIVNVAYISNVNVMKVGLEILLLVFRTPRILN